MSIDDAYDDERMKNISQNGNDGLCYELPEYQGGSEYKDMFYNVPYYRSNTLTREEYEKEVLNKDDWKGLADDIDKELIESLQENEVSEVVDEVEVEQTLLSRLRVIRTLLDSAIKELE